MSEQQKEVSSPRRRSFFRAPAFWTGNLLWLVVIFLAANGWLPKPRVHSAPPPASQADPKSAAEDAVPKQITITTDKDGNAKVLMPGEKPASPWDKDGIADFSFIDTDEKTVTKKDLLGKPWVVCFVFTHCAFTCPTVTNSMRDLQDQLKPYDFRLVTLTVDPARDTPEILKEYGKSRGADFRKWMFLGGNQRDIYRLINGSFKMPVKELQGDQRKVGFEFLHSNNIMLVDEKGVVQGKFDAMKGTDMAALRREIQKMAKRTDAGDAPAEKSGK